MVDVVVSGAIGASCRGLKSWPWRAKASESSVSHVSGSANVENGLSLHSRDDYDSRRDGGWNG